MIGGHFRQSEANTSKNGNGNSGGTQQPSGPGETSPARLKLIFVDLKIVASAIIENSTTKSEHKAADMKHALSEAALPRGFFDSRQTASRPEKTARSISSRLLGRGAEVRCGGVHAKSRGRATGAGFQGESARVEGMRGVVINAWATPIARPAAVTVPRR